MDVITLVISGTAAMGAFATAGAIVAGVKGRHAAGAIWGMLLGPVGLVVACFLEADQTPIERSDAAAGPSFSGVTYAKPGAFKGEAPTKRQTTLGDEMR